MANSLWTDEEVAYLMKNYQNQHPREIALNLNRTYSSVVQKMFKHRLSSSGRQLKEFSVSEKIQVKTSWCNLPTFHPVMIGIYPNSITKKSGSTSRWLKRRAIILKMHDYCCAYCGDEANTVDHVIPTNRGGTDDPLNLVAACAKCNYGYGDRNKHLEFKITTYTQPVDNNA